MKYRPEIDGLRAFAVVPVILNHANLPYFAGGFIGVDIFFVISGYLISKIIYADVIAGQFSIFIFYERRIRRIFPALLVVLAFSFTAAHLLMLPDPYENFTQSVIATLLFSNNLLLAMTSGYWQLESAFKPLLHTWSLGVEEQFYIFYPILVMLAARFSKRWLISALVFGAIVSFGLSVGLSGRYPDASFYLLHTRAWELLIGALVATIDVQVISKRINGPAAAVGLALILVCIVSVSEGIEYPGYIALLPCLGAALVIVFATSETFVHRLLSQGPLVAIGVISYSAYLWHQPIFAFARISSVREPSLFLMILLSASTLAVAYLSWRYVETPFRSKSRFSRNQIFAYASTGSAILITGAFTVYSLGGLPERVPGIGLGHGSYIAYNERVFELKKDSFSTRGKPHLMVAGNSTGRDLVNVLIESGRFDKFEIIYRDDISICLPDKLSNVQSKLVNQSDAII
ncbi:MAG: acyltransferase, partial [Sphingobium sp.]